jgi:hypothetical protein
MTQDCSDFERCSLELLANYHKAMSGGEPEAAVDAYLLKIEELSPNSDFSGMMFYGEMERSDEELAIEAARRETVFREHGRHGVLEHIRQQMCAALADPNLTQLRRRHAEMKIVQIDEQMPAGHA